MEVTMGLFLMKEKFVLAVLSDWLKVSEENLKWKEDRNILRKQIIEKQWDVIEYLINFAMPLKAKIIFSDEI